MPDALNGKIEELRRRCEEKEHLADRVKALDKDLTRLAAERRRLNERVRQEKRDVDQLEGATLTALFAVVLGNREEKRRKEREEFVAAKLKLDQVVAEIEATRQERDRRRRELVELGDPEREESALLRTREARALDQAPCGSEVLDVSGEIGAAKEQIREVGEAITAASAATRALRRALHPLRGASGWGWVDFWWGGLFSAIAAVEKHGAIETAKGRLLQAQIALSRLQREVKDVGSLRVPEIEIGSLATFSDFVFDGMIADWWVQSKLGHARRRVAAMLRRCGRIRKRLVAHAKGLERGLRALEGRRRELLAEAK